MKTIFATNSRDLLLGGLFTVLVIVIQTWAMGVAIVFLDLGLVIALIVWIAQANRISNPNIGTWYLIAVGVQCFHFLEEFLTGFQVELPQFFGYAWSDQQFVALNLCWLGLFTLNGVGVYSGARWSYLLVFFLAIVGGIANGIGHPLLSLMRGGYFPGLYTSPLSLVAGLILVSQTMKSQQSFEEVREKLGI